MQTIEQLQTFFSERFYQSPQIVVRAPGRINLIGEHTDYNNGFVLPAAINKAVYIALGKSEKETGKWIAVELHNEVEVDFNNIKPQPHTWQNYLLGIIHQFRKKGFTVPAFNCTVTANVPVGAGMSSSAALECAIAVAINVLYNFNVDKIELAKMCQASEHEYVNVKVGIMDMFASLFGRKDHVIRLDCKSLSYEYFPLNIPEYAIVLFDTGVKHSLASGEYNIRRQQCEEGVSILKKNNPQIQSLRDVPMQLLNDHKGEMSEKIYNRCFYIIDEINRTQAACEDLLENNINAFGEKMYATHEGLSKLYEVSCKELDFFVTFVKNNPNVPGARMMGGGFGGCTINLIKKEAVENIYTQLKDAYFDKMQKELKMYEVYADDGAGVI